MPEQVDHKNRKRRDNRWKNLRAADYSINTKNKSKYKSNTSGHAGINYDSLQKKWRSRISVNGTRIHIGWFSSFEEALDARITHERFYKFNN